MRRVTGSGSGSGEQNDGGGEVHKINYYIVRLFLDYLLDFFDTRLPADVFLWQNRTMQFRRFTHDFILSFDTFNVTSLPLNNDIISNNTLPVNFSRTTKIWAALIWKDTQMNNVLQASNSDREPTGCIMFDKTFYSEVPCLEQGSHVIIQNLQTTKHNGKTGILQDFDPVKERWCVKVIEGPTEYIPNGGVINVTATVKKYRLKTANVKLLANTTPLYQTIADYRALDFPGQCELIWRTVLATCIYFEYLPETILLPSPVGN